MSDQPNKPVEKPFNAFADIQLRGPGGYRSFGGAAPVAPMAVARPASDSVIRDSRVSWVWKGPLFLSLAYLIFYVVFVVARSFDLTPGLFFFTILVYVIFFGFIAALVFMGIGIYSACRNGPKQYIIPIVIGVSLMCLFTVINVWGMVEANKTERRHYVSRLEERINAGKQKQINEKIRLDGASSEGMRIIIKFTVTGVSDAEAQVMVRKMDLIMYDMLQKNKDEIPSGLIMETRLRDEDGRVIASMESKLR